MHVAPLSQRPELSSSRVCVYGVCGAGAPLLSARMLMSMLWAMAPAGLINVYITGLNQVEGSLCATHMAASVCVS
jgi:hypothetical protein